MEGQRMLSFVFSPYLATNGFGSGPMNNFRGVKNYLFKNYSQKGVKMHKKNFVLNLLLRAPQMDFTF
jgi:hypothetical protein